MFEQKIDEMEDAKCCPDPDTLHRQYLSKISDDLQSVVMAKTWNLDGESEPMRKARTWEEVAEAVEMELETRADVKAPKDHVHTLGTGRPTGAPQSPTPPSGAGLTRCPHCLKEGRGAGRALRLAARTAFHYISLTVR